MPYQTVLNIFSQSPKRARRSKYRFFFFLFFIGVGSIVVNNSNDGDQQPTGTMSYHYCTTMAHLPPRPPCDYRCTIWLCLGPLSQRKKSRNRTVQRKNNSKRKFQKCPEKLTRYGHWILICTLSTIIIVIVSPRLIKKTIGCRQNPKSSSYFTTQNRVLCIISIHILRAVVYPIKAITGNS